MVGGGYDPAFRTLAFAQLDLCFRLHNRGLRHVYTPWAVAECGPVAVSEALLDAAEADRLLLQARWKKLLNRGDPWYNRNLLPTTSFRAVFATFRSSVPVAVYP